MSFKPWCIFISFVGRYLFQIGQLEKSVRLLKIAGGLYKELLSNSITTAQVINTLGSVLFAKGEFERYSLCQFIDVFGHPLTKAEALVAE